MSKSVVAVAERPNVGKSTLFNVITGNVISIVKDTPGVTRDRIYADCSWLDMDFILIDTGGIKPDIRDVIPSQMRGQAEIAISATGVIIFIVDVRQDLVDSDAKVADMLRKSHKPVVLAVNKVDGVTKFGNDVFKFYSLGIDGPVSASAASHLGIGDLLDEVVRHFDGMQAEEEDGDRPRITVVGKPNVGKSSIINKLLGENRMIISDITGTTRDAADTEIIYSGIPYMFTDTTGPRHKNKIKEEPKRYSIIRTVTAVEWVDIVVIVIDATEGVTKQDTKIAGIAHEWGKGAIVTVSKWDAIKRTDKTIYEHTNKIGDTLSLVPYVEYIFVSAQTGQRLPKLLELIDAMRRDQTLRVATGVLNKTMTEAVAMRQSPSGKGGKLKIYYMARVAVKPPAFVVLVNDKELVHLSYTRYLENQIRNAFGFKGISLKFTTWERKAKEQ